MTLSAVHYSVENYWKPDICVLLTYLFPTHTIFCFLKEGLGPEGHRGARVVWVCGGDYLLVSGFDRYPT